MVLVPVIIVMIVAVLVHGNHPDEIIGPIDVDGIKFCNL
jgi:hypothetical protein